MSTAQLEQTTQRQGTGPGPTPEKLFETLTAYQQTAALKAAIELDLFTAIAEGRNSVLSLVRRIQGSERGVRILCDFLVVAKRIARNYSFRERKRSETENARWDERMQYPYLSANIEPLHRKGIIGFIWNVA